MLDEQLLQACSYFGTAHPVSSTVRAFDSPRNQQSPAMSVHFTLYGPPFHKKYTPMNRHLHNVDVDSKFMAILLVFTCIKQ